MTIHTLLVVLLVFAIIAGFAILTMVIKAHKKIWEAIRDISILVTVFVCSVFVAIRSALKPRHDDRHPLI